MKYRVFDTCRNCFVEDDEFFILKQDGSIKCNNYGDEIGIPGCIPIFYPLNNDKLSIDEVGGTHLSGSGTTPDGKTCKICSLVSCSLCSTWLSKQERKGEE